MIIFFRKSLFSSQLIFGNFRKVVLMLVQTFGNFRWYIYPSFALSELPERLF